MLKKLKTTIKTKILKQYKKDVYLVEYYIKDLT
jgi:hypothetical protein